MTLDEYLVIPESKYAVLRHDSYLQDPIAQSISSSPRTFEHSGIEMVVLSLEPLSVPELAAYANSAANGVEFELTIGSGKVTLLLHSQILSLLE